MSQSVSECEAFYKQIAAMEEEKQVRNEKGRQATTHGTYLSRKSRTWKNWSCSWKKLLKAD